MIILRRIQLENFLSHKHSSLDLKEGQKLLISGKSGSGKSAVVEGLIWCLYGRSRVDNHRNLIKHGSKAASVTVTLDDLKDGNITRYEIERNITAKGTHSIKLNRGESLAGEDPELTPVLTAGIRGSQEYIENEILHSTYTLFINSIAYPQDNVETFVRQSADKRKDIILEIIHGDTYDKYYEKTREALTDRQNKGVILDTRINYLINDQDQAKIDSSTLPEVKNDLLQAEEKLEKEMKDLTTVQDAIREVTVQKQSLSLLKDLEKQYQDNLNSLVEANNKILLRLEEIAKIDITDLKKKADRIPAVELEIKKLEEQNQKATEWNDRYISILKELPVSLDYDLMVEEMNRQLIEVMGEEINECPELKKICPILKTRQDGEISKMTEKIKELEGKSLKQAVEIAEYENKILDLGERPETGSVTLLRLDLDNLRLFERQYLDYKDKETVETELKAEMMSNRFKKVGIEKLLKETLEKIESISGRYVKLEDLMTDERGVKYDIHILENLISKTKTTIFTLESNLKKVEELEGQIKELREEKVTITEETECLSLLKEAFSPKGIKAIVVDYVIPQLEDKINEILGKLSDFTVRLDTQKSGVSGDTTLEGLFITIMNEQGEEAEYSNYSGGEKLKITVAITEALAEVQKMSFRILDELFTALDEESTISFAKVMETLNNRFSQMLCITHLREIKTMFPEVVEMTKLGGTTKMRYDIQ